MIERLDGDSLEVVASTRIVSPSDLLVTPERIWVITTTGKLYALRPDDLSIVGSVDLESRGPARIADGGDVVWVLSGQTDPSAYLLTSVDARLLVPHEPLTIDGGGIVGALASGADLWVGTLGEIPGTGRLQRLQGDGALGLPVQIGAPVALVEAFGRVWWASTDGRLGATAAQVAYDAVQVGPDAAAAVASGGLIWVASDRLVGLKPAP